MGAQRLARRNPVTSHEGNAHCRRPAFDITGRADYTRAFQRGCRFFRVTLVPGFLRCSGRGGGISPTCRIRASSAS